MDHIQNVRSMVRPCKIRTVNTGSRYSFNIRQETEEIGGQQVTMWVCDQYWFPIGEFDMVQNGILPAGGVWDDALRSIERANLYREADDMLSKYSTDEPDQERYDAWKSYKHFVRLTQNAPGYPLTVEYPPRPE